MLKKGVRKIEACRSLCPKNGIGRPTQREGELTEECEMRKGKLSTFHTSHSILHSTLYFVFHTSYFSFPISHLALCLSWPLAALMSLFSAAKNMFLCLYVLKVIRGKHVLMSKSVVRKSWLRRICPHENSTIFKKKSHIITRK